MQCFETLPVNLINLFRLHSVSKLYCVIVYLCETEKHLNNLNLTLSSDPFSNCLSSMKKQLEKHFQRVLVEMFAAVSLLLNQ